MMDGRTKELIAIGASVTANCQPCLRYHVQKAQEFGADERDITESIAVGRMVRKGASDKFDRFVESTYESAAPSATEAAPGGACG